MAAVGILHEPLDFRALGTIEAVAGDGPLPIGGPKQRAVLAILLVNVGRRVSTESLIDGVYGGDPPDGARRSVQTYVSNLRAVLGDVITSRPDGYQLDVERDHFDVAVFEDTVEVARSELDGDPSRAGERLREALESWRGHPYADVDGGSEVAGEIAQLAELRLVALELRIEADLAIGRHELLVPELQALVAEHPFRERFAGQLMVALYRSGRQAEALRAYEATRSLLVDELGIDPSPELRDLEQQILAQERRLSLGSRAVVGRRALLAVDVDTESLAQFVAEDRRVEVLVATDATVNDAAARHDGSVFAQRLNATFASFDSTEAALAAAIEIVSDIPPQHAGRSPVRVAVDVGDVEVTDDDMLVGPVVTRVGGLMGMAHAGQVLLSETAQREAASRGGSTVKGLGRHRIPQLDRDEPIFQLVVAGVDSEFPPPRSEAHAVLPGGLRMMPGYELREEVGRSAEWRVWRAYQPSVGREVAVTIVGPDLANRPEFVRKFELHALTVARLEHPHIVPLFDYWRDPSGAYLVNRWIEGGSLADRLRVDGLDLDSASRLVAQIGSALESAHRAGIAHGRVSARSILVDDEGIFYLRGFAMTAASGDGRRSVRDDVAALAETLIAAVDPESVAGHAVARLADESQPASAAELVAAWTAVAGDQGSEPVFTPTRNPYRGLDAFTFADADDFHGRDVLVGALLEAIGQRRLVAIVGPSGVGKSSLVQAGVVPALVAGAVQGSAGWFLAAMTPGTHPFEALGSALLRVATVPLPSVDEELSGDDRGMVRVLSRAFPAGSEVVLVIDQFEELFTLTTGLTRRQRFLRALTELVTDPGSNVRVVVTIRADFFDQPLMHPEFGELLRTSTVPLSAPTEDELRTIIERPAAGVGVGFEAGLVELIVSDVGGQPGRLPLLEYALTELFAVRTADIVTAESYEAMGGVLGALGRRAEKIYQQLDEAARGAARQVFLRLVTLADSERVARRRVRRSELDRLDLDPATIDEVVDVFAGHRLLTLDRDSVTHGPTVEVAHEAIFFEWDRLRHWIEERRDDLATRRRLVEAAQDWDEAGRDKAMLLGGGRLAHFEEWVATTDLSLTASERELLEESLQQRAAATETARRRRRRILSGFAAAAVVALVLAAFATTQWRNAAEQRNEARVATSLAEARELILEADRSTEADPELGIHLALAAIDAFRRTGEDPPSTAVDALRRAVAAQRTMARFDGGGQLALSPSGDWLATWDVDGALSVRDRASLSPVAVPAVEGGAAVDFWFGAAVNELYAAFEFGSAERYSLMAWSPGSSEWETLIPELPSEGATWVELSADGRTIVIMHEGVIRGTQRDTGDDLGYEVEGMASSGVWAWGELVAFGVALDNGRYGVSLADPVTGAVNSTVGSLDFEPTFLSFAPAGDSLAVANQGGDVAVIDVASGEVTWSRSDLDRANKPVWLPGDRILIGGEVQMRVFDALTGDIVLQTPGVGGVTFSYALIPGTELLLATGPASTETVILDVSVAGRGELDAWASPVGEVFRMFAHEDGTHLVVDSWEDDGGAAVVEAGTGRVVTREDMDDHASLANVTELFVATSNGRYVAGPSPDGRSHIWDVATGEVVYTAPDGLEIGGMSPNADLAVIQTFGGPIRLVQTGDGTAIADLDAGLEVRAAFSPDAEYVLTNNNGQGEPNLQLYRAGDGEYLGGFGYNSGGGEVTGPWSEFTPDGEAVVVGGANGVNLVLDVQKMVEGASEPETVIQRIEAHDTFIIEATVSPGGDMIASSAWDEPGKLWDVESGEPIGEFGTAERTFFAFHPTEPRLFVADSAAVTIHTLDLDELMDIARSRLTREMTDAECERYLRMACPTG